MRRLALLSAALLFGLAACGSGESGGSSGGKATETTSASDYAIVPDAAVNTGLASVKTIASAATLDTDAMYAAWFAVEGTVRARDKNRYLDIEDALAGVKAAKSAATVSALGTAIDAYLAAHPSDGSEPPLTTKALKAQHTTVVRLDDYEITMPLRLQHGVTKFEVSNHSRNNVKHELVIFRSALDSHNLPVDTRGRINEAGQGLLHLTEIENVKPGADGVLLADLPAGDYVFACNVDDHYRRGMVRSVRVA